VPFKALTEGGVKADNMTSNTPDRIAGALEIVSPARMRADNPSMACSPNDCFIVWHEELRDGVWAAPLPIGTSTPLYKREVVRNLGRNPGIAVDARGQYQMFWFERTKLMTSRLDRDGVREASVVGRMTTADRPEPSVSPGLAPNQWFVAWNDFEGGHPEAFVARVDCK
jgi:serine/threonine-protein kinase